MNTSTEDLTAHVCDILVRTKNLAEANAQDNIDQTSLIEEECSELIQAICKLRRNKGSRENLAEESCDIMVTCLVYLRQLGWTPEMIYDQMMFKLDRQLERHERGEK